MSWIRHALVLIRWKLAWYRWFVDLPGYRFGDPSLGPTDSALRDQNRRILRERHAAREPKRPEL